MACCSFACSSPITATSTSYDRLVRRVLREHPERPRPISYVEVAAAVWQSASSVVFAVFGVASLLAAFVFFTSRGEALLRIAGSSFFGLFGLLVLSAPFVKAFRLRRALANGAHHRATIIALSVSGANRQTLDAMKHGFAAGTLRVPYRSATFDERFEYDGAGAASLRMGDTINVLVDEDRPRVLFVLGRLDRLPDR